MPIGQGAAFGLGGLSGLGLQQGLQPAHKRSGFGSFLFGSPEKSGQLSRYSNQNQGQFNDLISQILSGYQSGQIGSFAPIAEAAQNRFQTRTLPSIMERLTSLGGGGGRSNAYYNLPAQAAVDLQLGLAGQESQYGLQQQQLLQQLLGLGQQEPFYQPRTPGFLENLFGGVAQGAGQLGGTAAKLAMLGL